MHRALELSDILTCIFNHSDKKTIGRAAVVCKRWSDTANNVLWKNISCLWTLINVLCPLTDQQPPGHTIRGFIFTQPYAPKDWERFAVCAARVQEVDYDPSNRGHRFLANETFTILASTRPTIDLIPNLRRIFWVIEDDISFSHVLIFMSSHVESLHLVLGDTAITVDVFKSFMEDLPRRCPNLIKLKLDFDIPISSLEPVMSNLLSSLTSLQELGLPAYCITSQVLHAVSKHRRLRIISSKPVWGNRFLGAADDVRSLDISDLAEDSFPALKDLEIDTSLSVATTFLGSQHIPRTLTRLFVSSFETEPANSLRELLKFIAAEFKDLKYLGITCLVRPTDDNPPVTQPITFDTLRPALTMRKLTHFLFMHNLPLSYTEENIVEMGSAWGDTPLRHLRLVPDPVYTPLATLDTDIRLSTLQLFARHLPKLEHLEVYLDATKDIPSETPYAKFPLLHTLDIGISPIQETEQGAVARWLAKLVPRTMTLAFQAGWAFSWARVNSAVDNEVLMPRRRTWQRVGDLHTQLCIAAAEQAKEITSMAQNLTDKTTLLAKLEEEVRKLREELGRSSLSAQEETPKQDSTQKLTAETQPQESQTPQPESSPSLPRQSSEIPQQDSVSPQTPPPNSFTVEPALPIALSARI